MTMIEAVGDGLRLMADVFNSVRKVDEQRIRAFMFVIQEDGLHPEDVEKACKWFCRDGEGTFPSGPVFRRRCIAEKTRRELHESNMAYQARMEAEKDPFESPEEWVSQAEARAIIAAALARLDAKQKHDNPLTRRDKTAKDIQRDIQAVRS